MKKENPLYILGILETTKNYKDFEKSKGKKYKEYRDAWSNRLFNKDPGNAPLNLNAEVTTKCNMACTFCYNSALNPSEVGTLPLELFGKVVSELIEDPDFSAVNLNGLGESLMVSNFSDYVKTAKSAGVIDVMFHTNASIMNQKIASELLSAGVDKVIFSVDSPDKETYESMRLQKTSLKGFPFEQIRQNVLTFKETRDHHSSNNAVIRCTMVLTDTTKSQVTQFKQYWGGIADLLTVQDLTWRDNVAYDWENGESSPNNIVLEDVKRILVEKKCDWSCPYVYQSLFIHQDGNYVPCSNPYARKELIMGNSNEKTAIEVWNSQEYKKLRSFHDKGQWYEHPTCNKCEIAIIEALKLNDEEMASSFATKEG